MFIWIFSVFNLKVPSNLRIKGVYFWGYFLYPQIRWNFHEFNPIPTRGEVRHFALFGHLRWCLVLYLSTFNGIRQNHSRSWSLARFDFYSIFSISGLGNLWNLFNNLQVARNQFFRTFNPRRNTIWPFLAIISITWYFLGLLKGTQLEVLSKKKSKKVV